MRRRRRRRRGRRRCWSWWWWVRPSRPSSPSPVHSLWQGRGLVRGRGSILGSSEVGEVGVTCSSSLNGRGSSSLSSPPDPLGQRWRLVWWKRFWWRLWVRTMGERRLVRWRRPRGRHGKVRSGGGALGVRRGLFFIYPIKFST